MPSNNLNNTLINISAGDIATEKTVVNQIVDILQSDVQATANRKKYEVFVTGGVNLHGVTSSLYQTVFDQDHTLQASNEMLDMTVGLFSGSTTVSDTSPTLDANGKLLFPSQSLMMREKINLYRQFAQQLLGNADSYFVSPFDTAADDANIVTKRIDEALFINFKRLFTRDQVKKESFAMKIFSSASLHVRDNPTISSWDGTSSALDQPNLNRVSTVGGVILSDRGVNDNQRVSYSGEVGNIVLSTNSSDYKGLIFYDMGIIVLDMKRAFFANQIMSGTISSIYSSGDASPPTGLSDGLNFIGLNGKRTNYDIEFISTTTSHYTDDTPTTGDLIVVTDLDGNSINFVGNDGAVSSEDIYTDATDLFKWDASGGTAAAKATAFKDAFNLMLTGSFEGLTQAEKPRAFATVNNSTVTLTMIEGGANGSVAKGSGLVDGNLTITQNAPGSAQGPFGNQDAKLIPDLMVSGSIDDIVDHIAGTRFGDGSLTCMAFQNETKLNSTLVSCRAAMGQANYSSNDTYTDDNGKIQVVDLESDAPFAYVTTVGLYDASRTLVAVAKTSRPILKDPTTDLSIRVRLDF